MKKGRLLANAYLVLVFGFLYVPIAVLIAFSFNESKSRTVFTGFTFKWYQNLFHNDMVLKSLGVSLGVAFAAACIATVVGTLASIGISSMNKRARGAVMAVSYVPVVNPEIITGVSLMLLFVVFNRQVSAALSWLLQREVELQGFGLGTLLIAHITFCLPYVIFNVSPKLRQLDPAVYDAALDLGCNPRQAFFKVVLPQLTPAILSAFLISLTYSIDDFIISYFTSGTMQTLPIAIYSMTKKKVSPEINALSAIMFVVILTIILAANAVDSAKERRLRRPRAQRRAGDEAYPEGKKTLFVPASCGRACGLPVPRGPCRTGRRGGCPRLRLHPLQGRGHYAECLQLGRIHLQRHRRLHGCGEGI